MQSDAWKVFGGTKGKYIHPCNRFFGFGKGKMILLCWLILSVVCHSGVANHNFCEENCSSDNSTLQDGEIAFSVAKTCSWDRVEITYAARIPKVAGFYSMLGIGIFDDETDQLIRKIGLEDGIVDMDSGKPLGKLLVDWTTHQVVIRKFFDEYENDQVPNIGCEVLGEWESQEEGCKDGQHWPKMVKIEASPGYGDGSNFTVRFNRNTNEPPVATEQEIRNIISFSGSIGKTLTGKWVDPKTLVITVIDAEGHVNYHEESLSAALVTRPRQGREKQFRSLEDLVRASKFDLFGRGVEYLRFGFPRRVYASLFVVDATTPVAKSGTLRIEKCFPETDDDTIVVTEPSAYEEMVQVKSIYHMEERVVMQHSKLLLPRLRLDKSIAKSNYEPFDAQKWSLTFWLNLAPRNYLNKCSFGGGQSNNGGFRPLLFHGPGHGPEGGTRTPSIWMYPHDNRLALRVSTVTQMDFGSDSDVQVPENSWVHLALVVENKTEGFSAMVYMNGEPIVSIVEETGGTVLATEGFLRFGHDAWTIGPEGYVEHLEMFSQALSRYDIHMRMAHTRPKDAHQVLFPERHLDCSSMDMSMDQEFYELAQDATTLEEKKSFLLPAAQDNHSPSLFMLGALQEDRFSDHTLSYFQRAGELGHPDALFAVAMHPILAPYFSNERDKIFEDKPFSLEWAALHGSREAKLVLGHQHMRAGRCRASVYYFAQVAQDAFVEHTSTGTQPMIEMQALSDFVEEAGERGDDDEQIQYQMHRAEKGDVDAMFAMGGLYYWGARGLERDQTRAFRYFQQAAGRGHAGAQTACGNMLLKGEGVEGKNLTKAMEYYENATKQDNLEALNGLGYIYYFGNGNVTKNVSKALTYFERNLRDGDSLFNAAHIYLHERDFRNQTRAIVYLERAASEFGSFSAIHALGEIFLVSGSCLDAQKYLRIAALRGSWGGKLRDGFDDFLDRRFESSAISYLEAAYMGYSRGAENAVYLLHDKLRILKHGPYEDLFQLIEAPLPPLQRMVRGDIAYDVGNTENAIQDWVAASVDGNWNFQPVYRAQASHNLGVHAMQLGQWERAEKYFQRAESFLEQDDSDAASAARIALKLTQWRLYLAQKTREFLPEPIKNILIFKKS